MQTSAHNSLLINCFYLYTKCFLIHLEYLPLFWFSESFLSTCFRITHIVINSNFSLNYINFLHYFTEFSIIQILYLFYVFSINYFQSQRPTANQIMNSFNQINSNRDNELKLILSEKTINNYLNVEFKASNVFKIDDSFLFKYFNTIITFTVMSIQFFVHW